MTCVHSSPATTSSSTSRREGDVKGLAAVRLGKQQAAQAEAMRYSVTACAEALGVSDKTYIAIEADPEHRLTPERARILADHFGVDVTDIFLSN